MARKQETNKYEANDGPIEVTLTQMGGMDGSKLGIRLGGMLGPSIITLFTAMDSQSAQAGGEAGRMLFEKLTPQVFEGVLKEMLAGAQVKRPGTDGEMEFEDATLSVLNEVFAGYSVSIYKLAFDAMRLNFRNFTQGLGISSATVSKLEAIAKKQMNKAGL